MLERLADHSAFANERRGQKFMKTFYALLPTQWRRRGGAKAICQ
jgi:hypothetical protein